MKTTVLFLFLLLGVTGYSQIGNKEIIMDLSKPELRIGIPENLQGTSKDNLSEKILVKLIEEMAKGISTQITNDLSDKLYENVFEMVKLTKNDSVKTDEQKKEKLADIISKEILNILNVKLPKSLSNEFSKLTFLEFSQKDSDNLVEEITQKVIRRIILKTNEKLTDAMFNNLLDASRKNEVTEKIRSAIQPELSIGLKNELETKMKDKLYNGIDIQKTKWLSVKARQMPHIKIINGNPLKYIYKIDTRELSFYNESEAAEKKLIEEVIKNREKEETNLVNKIEDILVKNTQLNQKINDFSIDFETFYNESGTRSSINKEEIISKRQEYLKSALKFIYELELLLNKLEAFKSINEYEGVKSQVKVTKEKAQKLKEEITKKLYGFDFETFTLPIDVQGKNIDAIEFRLKRFDRETKEEDTGFAPHPYNIWIRDGFKIDISAGVYFSKLFDDVLDKKDDPAIAGNKIILKKNQGDYDFALGSSVNVHYRCNSWVSPGFNLGVAFTTNQKFQMLLGGHLVFGKQERLIFTTGVAVGKVERLSDSYKVGGSYDLGAEGTIPTQTQFKFGHFFGVTYNLSKVKKISLEKGIEQ